MSFPVLGYMALERSSRPRPGVLSESPAIRLCDHPPGHEYRIKRGTDNVFSPPSTYKADGAAEPLGRGRMAALHARRVVAPAQPPRGPRPLPALGSEGCGLPGHAPTCPPGSIPPAISPHHLGGGLFTLPAAQAACHQANLPLSPVRSTREPYGFLQTIHTQRALTISSPGPSHLTSWIIPEALAALPLPSPLHSGITEARGVPKDAGEVDSQLRASDSSHLTQSRSRPSPPSSAPATQASLLLGHHPAPGLSPAAPSAWNAPPIP